MNRDETSLNSSKPKFWLEFRCFDDGLSESYRNGHVSHRVTTEGEGSDGRSQRDMTATVCSFPQFGFLPPELRLKIWSCLIVPRILVVACMQRDDRLSWRKSELRERTHGSLIPALLHVNRESRDVGLQYYELTFSWKISALLSDTPLSRPPQVYFNYGLDALYLTGELEAYDNYGFNSPMVYFLRREDTTRVRHVACAFADLGYPEQESDQIFGCLWHVVDRFNHQCEKQDGLDCEAGKGKLWLAVRRKDEEEIGQRDGEGSLAFGEDNVMQKIWRGWMGGFTVLGSMMADRAMVLVREGDLSQAIDSG